MGPRPYIVVVGGGAETCERVLDVLRRAGLRDAAAVSALSLDDGIRMPDLIVTVGASAPRLCREARDIPLLMDTPIVGVVRHASPDAIAAMLRAGADDVVSGSELELLLPTRARALARATADSRRASLLEHLNNAMLRVHALSARSGDSPDVLRKTLLVAVEAMRFERASLIAHVEGSDLAYVIAATDDPTLSQFVIAVDSYPEVRAALQTGESILVDDALEHLLTAPVRDTLTRVGVRGMAVFPVQWKDTSLGVVLFRKAQVGVGHVNRHRMAFGKMFAKHMAARLSHGKVLESLKDQTNRISRARYEVERRLRTMDTLKAHFEAAADGVFVLDQDGCVLFANHAAADLTGFALDGLIGTPLADLVPEPDRSELTHVIECVLDGQNLAPFDLLMNTTSGEVLCVSTTSSTVLSRSGAVILSFRDVTAQRALEAELRQTTEFLERLIDSTVDGIVAADLRGNVIIFNQGAERIWGYGAEDVIAQIPVWKLYDHEVNKQIMRMLRSTSYGGVGRLEPTRREILNRDGELVPVNMTASIVYEEGQEVATVGIFSDLRDRIRIEQRLLQAQEQLQLTEKQALVAELAGAAAHELNQPLTSIICYAQLLQRQYGPDAPQSRAVDTIFREADRMAEIVKKIGRITKYETKEYVGSTRMLDLEKASRRPSTAPGIELPDDASAELARDAVDAASES